MLFQVYVMFFILPYLLLIRRFTYMKLKHIREARGEELDGPTVSALGVRSRMLSKMQSKNVICRAPPCFGSHVKPLCMAVPAVLAARVGYDPYSVSVIHKESLCPDSGDIKRLIMIMEMIREGRACPKAQNTKAIDAIAFVFFRSFV
jgi:hypothetical protein